MTVHLLQADPPDLIETHAHKQSSSRIDELAQIFIHATTVSFLVGQRGHRVNLLNSIDGEGLLGHGPRGQSAVIWTISNEDCMQLVANNTNTVVIQIHTDD